MVTNIGTSGDGGSDKADDDDDDDDVASRSRVSCSPPTAAFESLPIIVCVSFKGGRLTVSPAVQSQSLKSFGVSLSFC